MSWAWLMKTPTTITSTTTTTTSTTWPNAQPLPSRPTHYCMRCCATWCRAPGSGRREGEQGRRAWGGARRKLRESEAIVGGWLLQTDSTRSWLERGQEVVASGGWQMKRESERKKKRQKRTKGVRKMSGEMKGGKILMEWTERACWLCTSVTDVTDVLLEKRISSTQSYQRCVKYRCGKPLVVVMSDRSRDWYTFL